LRWFCCQATNRPQSSTPARSAAWRGHLYSGLFHAINRYRDTGQHRRHYWRHRLCLFRAQRYRRHHQFRVHVGRHRTGAGDDIYYGANGTLSDAVLGGTGQDRLIGGAGIDELQGGDTFIFANGGGRDIIEDFSATANSEKIDLSAVTAINNFAQLSSAASQVGADVLIDTGGSNSIAYLGVALTDLGDGGFIF